MRNFVMTAVGGAAALFVLAGAGGPAAAADPPTRGTAATPSWAGGPRSAPVGPVGPAALGVFLDDKKKDEKGRKDDEDKG